MPRSSFRLPGRADTLGAWLAALFPGVDRSTRRRWIADGRVSIDGRAAERSAQVCAAGARVEIEGVDAQALPPRPAGPHSDWLGLIDAVPWRRATLRVEGDRTLEVSIDAARDGLAPVRIQGSDCDAETVARALATAGMPLVGDLEHGGLGVVGGVRLAAGPSRDPLPFEWPDEPVWVADADEDAASPPARVSDETARAIEKGHPWILADAASDPMTRYRPGALVRVVTRSGAELAWARVEGDARLAARVWAKGGADPGSIPSVEARVARALARRRALLVDAATGGTDAFRLIHGEGDALPGLVVDRLGPLWRVLVTGRASDGIRARVLDALLAQLPLSPEGHAWSILELLHLRPPAGAETSTFERVRWVAGGPAQIAEQGFETSDDGFRVLERGLRFHVDPGWATPEHVRPGFGLFLDQRENRARLAGPAAQGGHWLNLFAHTGAFSVSLLAAGADRVTSVDLSAAYLARLEANLRANGDRGVDPSRHECVRIEGRRYLETLDRRQRFAGIVLDPPTAAAAGRRFWSLSRDLEPLLGRCVEHLAPGGVLLVTQNRHGPPLGLDRLLGHAAERAGRPIASLDPAPAGPDHPVLPGFPEGEPFEGWLLRLD